MRANGEFVKFFEPSCVVEDDPGEVVRGARPMTEADRVAIERERLERHIATLKRDPAAIAARERRIAMERGNVRDISRRRA